MMKQLLIHFCLVTISFSITTYVENDGYGRHVVGTCIHMEGLNCSDESFCFTRTKDVDWTSIEMVGCLSDLSAEEQKICTGDWTKKGYLVRDYDSILNRWTHSHRKRHTGVNGSSLVCCSTEIGDRGGPDCNRAEMKLPTHKLKTQYHLLDGLLATFVIIGLIVWMHFASYRNPSHIVAGKEVALKSMETFCGFLAITLSITASLCYNIATKIDCFKQHPEGYFGDKEKRLLEIYLSGHGWFTHFLLHFLGYFLLIAPTLEIYRIVAAVCIGSIHRGTAAGIFVTLSLFIGVPGCFYFVHAFDIADEDKENEYCRVGSKMWQVWLFPIASILYGLVGLVREGIASCFYQMEVGVPPMAQVAPQPQGTPVVVAYPVQQPMYQMQQPMYPVYQYQPAPAPSPIIQRQEVVHTHEIHVSATPQPTDLHTSRAQKTSTIKPRADPSKQASTSVVRSQVTQIEKDEVPIEP